MLVLTRKSGEAVRVGDDIRIVVVEARDGSVRIGIDAPRSKAVHREEVYLKIQDENISASRVPADVADALKRARKK